MLYKFELLCIDELEKVKFSKPKNFIRSLSTIEKLWKSEPIISDDCLKICDNIGNINISIQPFDISKMVTGGRSSSAYYIIVEGDFDNLEPFRLKFIEQLKDMQFNHRQILIDDVSNKIALDIYPLINNIETLLRKYIVKFFITKIGTDWWSIAVSKDTREKANNQKKNEDVFTSPSRVIANVTLLNFDQLGRIIYSQSSLFTKTEDIIDKIRIAEDLDSLKLEVLEGNFTKYFKDTFEQKDFGNKWEKLSKIRNKVAHNNYFFQKDLDLANQLCDELINIINNADTSIDALILSISDIETLVKVRNEREKEELEDQQSEDPVININEDIEENFTQSIIPENNIKPKLSLSILSEEKLIYNLKECLKQKQFVGLKYFVRDYLGEQGYSYNSSHSLINLLIDKGKIESYKIPNPYGDKDTTAIKLVE
ncbi:hypothetical protein FJR05_18085 [Dolichospermum sp. UHCC 0259]|nr:hypothetical protein [Dolichospermum sp. UHCC 0259]